MVLCMIRLEASWAVQWQLAFAGGLPILHVACKSKLNATKFKIKYRHGLCLSSLRGNYLTNQCYPSLRREEDPHPVNIIYQGT